MDRFLRTLALLAAALLLSHRTVAQEPEAGHDEPTSSVEVILVIDHSGSMIKNDPHGLRIAAAELIVGRLSGGMFFSAVRFNGEDDEKREGAPATVLLDSIEIPCDLSGQQEVRKTTNALIQQELSRPSGKFTDIKGALDTALNLSARAQTERRLPVVILITDGEIDFDGKKGDYSAKERASRRALLAKTITQGFVEDKIPVFPIGVTETVDLELLLEIGESTRGEGSYVEPFLLEDMSRLPETMSAILSRVLNDTLIRVSSRGEFFVDDFIDEMVFEMHIPLSGESKELLQIENLDTGVVLDASTARSYDTVEFYSGAGFNVLRIYDLTDEFRGRWRVAPQMDTITGARFYLRAGSRLRLVANIPQNVFLPLEPILVQAMLELDGFPVEMSQFNLSRIHLSAQLYEGGTAASENAVDSACRLAFWLRDKSELPGRLHRIRKRLLSRGSLSARSLVGRDAVEGGWPSIPDSG